MQSALRGMRSWNGFDYPSSSFGNVTMAFVILARGYRMALVALSNYGS
jgi:hypothetical protein